MTITANSIRVEKPTEKRIQELGARDWPIWTKEESEFDWHYDDQETCLILEGDVIVEGGGESVRFGAGDLVIFPKDLDCKWKVRKAVRKHYKFGK